MFGAGWGTQGYWTWYRIRGRHGCQPSCKPSEPRGLLRTGDGTNNDNVLVSLESRCKLLFDDKQPNVEIILQELHKTNGELMTVLQNRAASTGHPASSSSVGNVVKWTRPDHSAIKINCDGAWSSTSRQGGVGVIARDSTGAVRGGSQSMVDGGSTEEVKAKALLKQFG